MKSCIKTYLEEKKYTPNSVAHAVISQADDWYRIKATDGHKKTTINGESYELIKMGFAKRAAADDANLCEVTEVNGGGADEFVQELLKENKFDTQYRKQLELTSAEGTVACYIRIEDAEVMTDDTLQGGDIRLNYVDANGYEPLTVENDEVIEAAFWGESFKGTEKQTTLVLCTMEKGKYKYTTVVFDKEDKPSEPTEIFLGEVKPFAVMQNAEVNSIDNMAGFGFPKVYGAIPIFLALDGAFTALYGDVDTAEKITLMNELICGFDEGGKPITPNEQMKKRFVFLGEKLPQDGNLVHEITPEIRIEKFKLTIELLLSLMSMKFGYGTKKYSFENMSVETAAQYIGEKQDMIQELNKQRYQAKQYIEGIVRAALWFSNTYKNTSYNLEEEISIKFDDSYIESDTAKLESYKNDILSGIGGSYLRELYLKEKYNLDDKEAKLWSGAEDTEGEEGA